MNIKLVLLILDLWRLKGLSAVCVLLILQYIPRDNGPRGGGVPWPCGVCSPGHSLSLSYTHSFRLTHTRYPFQYLLLSTNKTHVKKEIKHIESFQLSDVPYSIYKMLNRFKDSLKTTCSPPIHKQIFISYRIVSLKKKFRSWILGFQNDDFYYLNQSLFQ